MRRLLCWLGWHVSPLEEPLVGTCFDPKLPWTWACVHCRKPWMEW